jgi:hypothetical protein
MDEQHAKGSTSGGRWSVHCDGDENVQRHAGRAFDTESLAALHDKNVPTGSQAASSIWFGPLVHCLAEIVECSFKIHER